jgi:hypothetical protein
MRQELDATRQQLAGTKQCAVNAEAGRSTAIAAVAAELNAVKQELVGALRHNVLPSFQAAPCHQGVATVQAAKCCICCAWSAPQRFCPACPQV